MLLPEGVSTKLEVGKFYYRKYPHEDTSYNEYVIYYVTKIGIKKGEIYESESDIFGNSNSSASIFAKVIQIYFTESDTRITLCEGFMAEDREDISIVTLSNLKNIRYVFKFLSNLKMSEDAKALLENDPLLDELSEVFEVDKDKLKEKLDKAPTLKKLLEMERILK